MAISSTETPFISTPSINFKMPATATEASREFFRQPSTRNSTDHVSTGSTAQPCKDIKSNCSNRSSHLIKRLLAISSENRVKRSTLANPNSREIAPSAAPSSVILPSQSTQEREEILDLYEHLIDLNQAAPVPPICLHGVEGQPNPPLYFGYASWESFLASDGSNSELRNPRQELIATLRSKITSFLDNQSNSLANEYDDYKRQLQSSPTREVAQEILERYQTKLKSECARMDRGTQIVSAEIIKKMSDEIRAIKHNLPNRWLQGHCWSSTTNARQWTEHWKSFYLPRALQALAAVAEQPNISLISTKQIQESWLREARNDLAEYFTLKGWENMRSPQIPPAERPISTNTVVAPPPSTVK